MKVTLTHRGWFGACPIYIGDVNTESPYVQPRLPFTGWFLQTMVYAYGAIITIMSVLAPWVEFEFMILFTGKLESPKVIEVDLS